VLTFIIFNSMIYMDKNELKRYTLYDMATSDLLNEEY
jgi:hypothetical protein